MSADSIGVGVIGIDHRHIYGQLAGMLNEGCHCKGWWTEDNPEPVAGFIKRFPDLPRIEDRQTLLADPDIDVILVADIPVRRAERAIEAMRAGKDVMTDKPGCTTLSQLEDIRRTIAETARIWSIDFSERFEVPAVSKAAELIQQGAIGKIVQTVGLGPHRLNRATRPDWFFDREKYGGILCDIASHQIDQFVFFTQSTNVQIVHSSVGNVANPDDPGLEDFGEILLQGENGRGYIRVDWFTPDGLPTWGDGRLTILGTEGYIELRKYVDIAGRSGTDHLFLVNDTCCKYIDASDTPLSYFGDFCTDIKNRSETAMTQDHCLKIMELAITAQETAMQSTAPSVDSHSRDLDSSNQKQ